MRVALVSPLFESVPPRKYGGTERVVYNLCRGLTAKGVDVTLFASADSEPGVPLVPTIDEALRLREAPVADPNVYQIRLLEQVAARAREFDVIHNHNDYWLLPLARMTRTPLLSTLHGRLDVPELTLPFREPQIGQFVAISESQRQGMPGLSWLRTILHGLRLEDFQFSPKPGRYLAFLGRISLDKRPEWAIEIARRSGIPLKIAAKIEGAESKAYFERSIRPHIDGKNIEYVGEISEREKSEFLGGALGLVFPIDWPEPFGLVMIEALACGTPVLARPVGSVPEILADGVTGFIRSDVGELGLRARDLPEISRAGCRAWIERRFSLDRMTEDYLDVYGALAGVRRIQAGAPTRAGLDRSRRNLVHTV
jgi:glycosyltransferase involved in cell wall biosynthesis